MNSVLDLEGNGEDLTDLPSVRDFIRSYNQVTTDFITIFFLLLQTVLQILVTVSNLQKSAQHILNVAVVQVSKVIHTVSIKQFHWKNVISVSDIYNVIKRMNSFFLSIAVSYFVLSLKGTYVWLYFVETLLVPIVTLTVPLQFGIHRQLIGPAVATQKYYVTISLWACNTILIYFILVSFLNVHLHHVQNRYMLHQSPTDEGEKGLHDMDFIHLLALMEIPLNLTVVSWKAIRVNATNINYAHTVKNTLILKVLYKCMSPIIGFVICFRSRTGLVYPLIYLHQMVAWGNSVVALAVYFTYETLINDTFPHLSPREVEIIQTDDVCPVCLMEHTEDSCRLACGHVTHCVCLVTLLQVSNCLLFLGKKRLGCKRMNAGAL
mgnify:FL=1